ncbi:imm11 family protein [Pyruvatibacter mobilis]|uniref:imm11 family protein n=1 Tax=Pyruvatibacter mobilis TaxID=1712261 RepID=UPI003BACFD82
MNEGVAAGTNDPAFANAQTWEATKATVWVSVAFSSTRLSKQADSDLAFADLRQASDTIKQNRLGKPLAQDSFPKEFYGHIPSRKLKKLADLCKLGGFWVVSAACADVLQQFDLGRTAFYPVKVYEHNRTTSVEGEYFCLSFGETKQAFLPEVSSGLRPRDQDPVREWRMVGGGKDASVAVHEEALQGVDLWIDPKLFEVVFLSDALVKALRAARMSRHFSLRKCRVLRPA